MNKSLILEKALEVFAEKGYYRTTIQEVADRAELSKRTVYRCIKTKEELFMELLNAAVLTRNEEVFKQIGITDDLKEKLSRFVISLIRFARNHRQYYRILTMEVVSDNPEFLNQVAKIQSEFQEQVYQILQEGVRQGRFREINPLLATTFLSKLIEGTLVIIENEPNYSSDQVILSMLDLFWNGLGKRSH
ncbi:MAG TPA: TetR/AcrR family transcriptional regulator [Bacillota bacterium]|nr:TetR/AcrR family transcriptional regulator [Bacillota bacterium]HPT86528.1 TetR/AcrR family transcriptional regulator [Bacillota bacterium]